MRIWEPVRGLAHPVNELQRAHSRLHDARVLAAQRLEQAWDAAVLEDGGGAVARRRKATHRLRRLDLQGAVAVCRGQDLQDQLDGAKLDQRQLLALVPAARRRVEWETLARILQAIYGISK